MRWVTLVTAPDQLAAEMWSELLNQHGIPTLVRAGDTSSFLGVSAYPCRILVDDEYLDEARQFLRDELGVTVDESDS